MKSSKAWKLLVWSRSNACFMRRRATLTEISSSRWPGSWNHHEKWHTINRNKRPKYKRARLKDFLLFSLLKNRIMPDNHSIAIRLGQVMMNSELRPKGIEKFLQLAQMTMNLSLIHIWRCRRSTLCRSRWSPYH